jgi:hypothetical protein
VRRESARRSAPDIAGEHAGEAGGSPHRRGSATAAGSAEPPTGDAADLIAGEAAEAVVAQGQLQDAVVLRAADVRRGTAPA